MTRLHVGRSTVREALNGLALTGVLEIRHGQGVFVASPAPATPEPGSARCRPRTRRDAGADPGPPGRRAGPRRTCRDPRDRGGPRRHRTAPRVLRAERRCSRTGSARASDSTRDSSGRPTTTCCSGSSGAIRRCSWNAARSSRSSAPLEDARYETHRRLFEAVAAHDAPLARQRMIAHLVTDPGDLLEGIRL